MPTFVIYTNQPKSSIADDFLKEATSLIATRLGKPASFVTVRVHPDQMMSHGGTTDPCASVELYSIGKLGPDFNDEHAAEIGKFISAKLNVPIDRFYVTFVDLERCNVGLNVQVGSKNSEFGHQDKLQHNYDIKGRNQVFTEILKSNQVCKSSDATMSKPRHKGWERPSSNS
ncbi:hypothetical protein KUTeg_009519 [Tegillarca granosa]|uniref:L-dopachrome isomerase n=1 Tax=Tegillarca granosa TaxID=220873 RepID=A0ABQ9F7F7_TEGGR|nr:hypothetical protein KUTeg_009519 [Tegillarca granosa]